MYYVASTITPIDMTDIVISINDNIKHLLNNTHHKKRIQNKYIYFELLQRTYIDSFTNVMW